MLRVLVQLRAPWVTRTIAIADIHNVGGTEDKGDYDAKFYGGEPFADVPRLGPEHLTQTSKVTGYPRKVANVWYLVMQALVGAFGDDLDQLLADGTHGKHRALLRRCRDVCERAKGGDYGAYEPWGVGQAEELDQLLADLEAALGGEGE